MIDESIELADQIGADGAEMLCSCGELHKGHICWLTHMGLIMEVGHLTDNPTFSCSKCGAKANLSHNLCFPVSFGCD